MTVSDQSSTIDLAFASVTGKLKNTLDTTFGRMQDRR